MTCEVRKSALSPACRKLITLMQQIQFGCIEDLIVQSGEPVFRPAPRIVREVKLGGASMGRPTAEREFVLKAQVINLFDQFDQIRNGRIVRLEIKHGLPFCMSIEAETGGTAA